MKKGTIVTIIWVATIIGIPWILDNTKWKVLAPAKSAIVWFDSQDFLHRILMLTAVGVVIGLTYRYSGHSIVAIGE